MRLFRGETCIFVPTPIEEFILTIWKIAPRQCRDGIDHLAQPGFRILELLERPSESFLRLPAFKLLPLSILDIERRHVPSIDFPLRVEQGIVADQEPSIFPILTQHTLLIFERYWACQSLLALLA